MMRACREALRVVGLVTVAALVVIAGGCACVVEAQPRAPSPGPLAEGAAALPLLMEAPLVIPMERSASGTAWQPDSTPLRALQTMKAGWMVMAHGSVAVGYDHQGSDRGRSLFIAPNSLMLMESRPAGGGSLLFRQMLSLDALTVTRRGYPLLLQSGESFGGEPLHDTQHPHDLFMELAASYTRPLSGSLALELYAAPAGEPALGPPAFMHRASAASDPLAPLGHHWQDSTHISFGVLTAGLFTRKVKVEGSWFNGREPDDRRFDFDFHRLDSGSGRISFNPTGSLSLQASYGFLASPEELEPGESVRRFTTSASLDRRLHSGGNWATTAVFGRNDPERGRATSSWLLETDLDLGGRSVVFGRAEYVRKSGRDLALTPSLAAGTFAIGNLVAGYAFKLRPVGSFVPALSVRGSLNFVGRELEPFYGTRHPAGVLLFLHVHPRETQGMTM